jgi:hypothetical protein
MERAVISWYSGYTGREYPLIFRYAGREYHTERLLSEKLIEAQGTKQRIRAFLIRTTEGELFEIIDGEEVEIRLHMPAPKTSS